MRMLGFKSEPTRKDRIRSDRIRH